MLDAITDAAEPPIVFMSVYEQNICLRHITHAMAASYSQLFITPMMLDIA